MANGIRKSHSELFICRCFCISSRLHIVCLKPFVGAESFYIFFCWYFVLLFVICVFYQHIRDERWTLNMFNKWSWCMFDKHYIPAGHKCLVGDDICWNKNVVDPFFLWGEKTKRNNECRVQRHCEDCVVRLLNFDKMRIYEIACKYWFKPHGILPIWSESQLKQNCVDPRAQAYRAFLA